MGCLGPLETNQGGEAKRLAAKGSPSVLGSPAAASDPRAVLGAAPVSGAGPKREGLGRACGTTFPALLPTVVNLNVLTSNQNA